jgi:hypothetical protein
MEHSDASASAAVGEAVPPTDILVAGSPGTLMGWTFDLLARAIAGRYITVAHLPITGDARWSPPDPASGLAARLFVGDFLQEAWVGPIHDGQVAAVLVIDDVSHAWAHLRQTGQQAAEATHRLVAAATSFGDLVGHQRVLIVTATAGDDLAALAARILAHVGMPVQSADDMVAALALGGPPQVAWELPPPIPICDQARPLIDAVILPALAYGATGQRVPVTWPRDCLFWGDNPGEPLPRALDLAGPSRNLAYGPYLALPPGRWIMSATLAFSPASRGAVLALELHGARELGRIGFTVEGPGLFKASVAVSVPSPREKLEIRLVSERGAIEGVIGIDHIAFQPD